MRCDTDTTDADARDRGTSDKVTDPAVAAQLAMLDGLISNARDAQEQQAFRDLRTSTLMPPTVDRMLEGIGKSALGIEGGMFKVAGG